MAKILAVVVAALMAGAGVAVAATAGGGHSRRAIVLAPTTTTVTTTTVPATTTTAAPRPTVPPTTRPPAPTTVASPAAAATARLAGCPVPVHPPGPPSPPPWHPAVLIPDSKLPAVRPPVAWRSDLRPLTGTGMWIWQWQATERGDAAAIVHRAVAAGLHQLWIRVGDSMNGFYGAAELNALVPAAHAAGLTVIAWGFPYLYDPAGDATWTARILSWRGPHGQAVDGYSADIERSSEGVALSATRAAVYLEMVRRSAGTRLIVATVYPPIDSYWAGDYPFRAMSPYVDAFAPMIYWECTDPGQDAAADVARLSTLRPVHVIGQAFNLADVGGRVPSPSAAEITEFLRAGKRSGAVGASFWDWQSANAEEWSAVGHFHW